MLARIKFTSDKSNRLNSEEVKKLEDFLGEKVTTSQLKITDDGYDTISTWSETFDPKKAEDEKLRLVTPADIYQISETNNYIVELEIFTATFPNLEVTIKGLPKSVSTDHADLMIQINKVAEKIEDAKNRFEKVVEFNQKCEVHVPNLGLLNLNKLAFATDYCTEALQQLLFQGWRILAICPQPDQRRPDYILGMHVSNLDDQVDVHHFNGDGREGYLKNRDKEKVGSY